MAAGGHYFNYLHQQFTVLINHLCTLDPTLMCIPIFMSMAEESKIEHMDLFQYEYGYIHLKSYFPCSILSHRNIYQSNNLMGHFAMSDTESESKNKIRQKQFDLYMSLNICKNYLLCSRLIN